MDLNKSAISLSEQDVSSFKSQHKSLIATLVDHQIPEELVSSKSNLDTKTSR